MKRWIKLGIVLVILLAYFFISNFPTEIIYGEKKPVYTLGELPRPKLSYSSPEYRFAENYSNPEYSLPLKGLPENYQRDVLERFGRELTEEQKNILLNNGVVIIPGGENEKFEDAYSKLREKDVPIFITSDSILHLFHIEFNEILKNLEIKKLSPMLKAFLKSVVEESVRQYNGFEDEELKELSKRNVAYLSVAAKLLDPNFNVPSFVRSDVEKEISRIEKHKGFYRSEIFSKDCNDVCRRLLFNSDDSCRQDVKVSGKLDPKYIECTKKCYCEDYSQYVPRGHYTQTEELKRYFKAMMWLGRMTFKLRGENWTKQAILLTDAVKSAKAEYNGSKIPAYELWNKIYTVTGFFAGASDDLTFYDYDSAVNKVFGYGFEEEEGLRDVSRIREEIARSKGPKILGGLEIDLAGNIKDLTQGMRLMGQRYALDSQILEDLVYKNVGPNPQSPYYEDVLNAKCISKLSRPKEFYKSCENMESNRTVYWNEVCSKAIEMYKGMCDKSLTVQQLFSVCRLMPSGLDVASVMGSERAGEFLEKYYQTGYCGYEERREELKELVNSYSQENWTKNLYNTWLWLLQPVLKTKHEGYPSWMRSEVWKTKDLITALSSWAELRHDTILYVKQSYTWAVGTLGAIGSPPMKSLYYNYVEPNPELFARAKFAVDFLRKGLEEQGVITKEVESSLIESSQMMERLEEISERELKGESLTEEDYRYIKSIDSKFNWILENLASALKVESGSCPLGKRCGTETSLEGEEEAFKTSVVADVHTDANTKKVLEVGTGKIDWVLVAHKSKKGRIGIAIGPVFSYYEFAWPMKDRLTDEKWRKEVLGTMERPVWYRELGISSSKSAYIIR